MNPHDHYNCPGGDRVLHLEDLADWLGVSTHTLYKWSSRGYPDFPKQLRLRNRRIAVMCRSTKAWFIMVSR